MKSIETAWEDITPWTFKILGDEDIYWQEWQRSTETETFSWDCGTWMKEQRIKLSEIHYESYLHYLTTGKHSEEEYYNKMKWQVWQGDSNDNWDEVSYYLHSDKRKLKWDILERLTLDIDIVTTDYGDSESKAGHYYSFDYDIPEVSVGMRKKTGSEWINNVEVVINVLEQWLA